MWTWLVFVVTRRSAPDSDRDQIESPITHPEQPLFRPIGPNSASLWNWVEPAATYRPLLMRRGRPPLNEDALPIVVTYQPLKTRTSFHYVHTSNTDSRPKRYFTANHTNLPLITSCRSIASRVLFCSRNGCRMTFRFSTQSRQAREESHKECRLVSSGFETQRHGVHEDNQTLPAPCPLCLCVYRSSNHDSVPVDDSMRAIHQFFLVEVNQQPEPQPQ